MSATGAMPRGWYPDPRLTGQRRYWDGTAWAPRTAAGEPFDSPIADDAPAGHAGPRGGVTDGSRSPAGAGADEARPGEDPR